MEFFAYLIWASLGTCLLIGIAVCVYTMFRNRSESNNYTADTGQETDIGEVSVDMERWHRVILMFQLNSSSLPQADPQRLAWAQDNLGIKPEWLQGEDTSMFAFLSFHNAVEASIPFIDTLRKHSHEVTLYVVKPCAVPLEEEIMEACAVLCFAHPAGIEESGAQRYYPVNVFWEWGYPPERVQCAQIIYAAVQAGFALKGVEVEQAELYDLLEGRSIPAVMLAEAQQSWDPHALASAGEDLAAVKKGMLSTHEFKALIDSQGWN